MLYRSLEMTSKDLSVNARLLLKNAGKYHPKMPTTKVVYLLLKCPHLWKWLGRNKMRSGSCRLR